MQHRKPQSQSSGQFYQEWLIVLAILLLAAVLRFWQLGEAPPGLYHDEAFNGLDALRVLDGERPLFFVQNNGREPLFIYTVALSVWQFGRTAFAIRFPAALFGTLTVIPLYLLTRSWFDRRVAVFAALSYAITLWPIHLSRLGFRVMLMPFFLALAAYILTVAAQRWQRQQRAVPLLVLAGVVYGLSFYTYLAARLTLVGVVLFALYLWWAKRPDRFLTACAWVAVATVVTVLPLVVALFSSGELLNGRTGDVSILSAAGGDSVVGMLIGNFGRSLAMFFIQGDTILRHNPAKRPVFDLLMALPFLFGVGWSIRHWRRPVIAALLIWTVTMLFGTILAEDAPHFLRVSGLLPVLLIFPAIGLSRLWNWSKLPTALGKILTGAAVAGSLVVTVNDYFIDYANRADTFYTFESAARELAEEANRDASQAKQVMIDAQFLAQWEAVPYLLTQSSGVVTFIRDELLLDTGPSAVDVPTSVFVWPYESRQFMPKMTADRSKVSVRAGSLSRLDSEDLAYPFYVNYSIIPNWQDDSAEHVNAEQANFDNLIGLHAIAAANPAVQEQLQLQLVWSAQEVFPPTLTAFVHVIDRASGALITQNDGPIGSSDWLYDWWRPEIFVEETRTVLLPTAFDSQQHALFVGVYDAATQQRLLLLDDTNTVLGDSLALTVR